MKLTLRHCLLFRALAVLLTSTLMPVQILSQTVNKPAARHIVICVDGVGISTISKMRGEGHFKMFHSPSRMISTYPSLTNAALSKILEPAGARMTGGYEDHFFDTQSNRIRGGILDRFRSGRFVRGTFRELFDYHPSAIKSGLGYAAPPVSTYLESLSDLIRLRQKARNSRQPVFFAYTGATDSLAHLGGETLLRSFLKNLDETIEDIARESDTPVTVTIFSDHGNDFRQYRRVALKEPLRQAGFKFESKIKDDQSLVLPQFGLVGSAVLFTREKNEERLAGVLATLEVKRIYEGATQGVLNRANVIINLEDGYYTGSSLLDTFTILQATHGNIGQEQSYGFVMSTKRELPPYIRAADLWETLGPMQLQRSPKHK